MLTPQQLEQRRGGISSSDAAAIVRISKSRLPMDVFMEKVGLVGPTAQTPAMEVGDILEDGGARIYAARTGESLMTWPSTTFVHPEHEWIRATPDRFVWNSQDSDEDLVDGHPTRWLVRDVTERLLEVKIVGRWMADDWGPDGDPNGVPDYVATQCQWQMLAMGIPKCDVIAVIGTDARIYSLEHSESFAAALFGVCRDFWFQNVVPRIPPDLDASESTSRYLRARFPRHDDRIVDTNSQLDELVRKYARARNDARVFEDIADELAARIQFAIGDAAGIAGEDYRITWKATKSGSVAYKALALELGATPEKIKQFTSPGSRTFNVSGPLFPRRSKELSE